MSDQNDFTLEPLRQSFAPDPATVDRVVEYALIPRKTHRLNARSVTIGLLLLAFGVAWLWSRPSARLQANYLSNRGDVFLYSSPSGVWIHNGPDARPAAFQVIWTGDSP